ncbi:MAG: ATP-binding protein [Candidatus Syntropharchaeia archaeon]
MGKTIAVTGKGGTGKTSVAALLIRYLTKKGKKNILAIDADPDTNLPEALGKTIKKTVGDIREGMLKEKEDLPATTDKQLLLEYKIMGIMEEGKDFDILAMGRPEGPGCYCAVNHQLRLIIDTITKNYDITIIDAEAGLEHLSRRTIRDVDFMLMVTDATKKGLETAKRIRDIARDLEIKVKKMYVVANKITENEMEKMEKYAEELGLDIIGAIPFDKNIASYDLDGKSLLELPDDSPSVLAIEEIAKKLEI